MTFEAPDPQRFPGLQLAWQVLDGPTGSTAVLNAANEVAVQAFLDRRIRFDQIHAVNRDALEGWSAPVVSGLADLLDIDARARDRAHALVQRIARA
jgi:1-deoxy-D-xylulose-5-phosphate reductoisomerase